MKTIRHEAFISNVRRAAMARLSPEERDVFQGIKLVYGSGPAGTRGVTFFQRWRDLRLGTETVAPFVEISAFGQENWVQVAGTTIHELAHVLAGPLAGHSKAWRDACERLGLRRAKAAGMAYCLAAFSPDIRAALVASPKPNEGEPIADLAGLTGRRLRACGQGIGTRGGTSRGKGSGSRLRLYECGCRPAVKVRAARDDLHAHCDDCGKAFNRA